MNLGKALNFSLTASLAAIFGLFPLTTVQAQRGRYGGLQMGPGMINS